MDLLYYEPGGYYFFEMKNIDYVRLFRIHESSDFFVCRAKDNLQFQRIYSNKFNKENGVLLDQIGMLTGFYVSKKYPGKLCLIKFYEEETDNKLEFISNNFVISLEEIAHYKY